MNAGRFAKLRSNLLGKGLCTHAKVRKANPKSRIDGDLSGKQFPKDFSECQTSIEASVSKLPETSECCHFLDDAASSNYVDTRRTRLNLTLINFRHQHPEKAIWNASARIHQPDARHLFNEPAKCSPQAEEIQLRP